MELPSKPLSYVVKIIKIDKSKKLDRKLQLKSLKRNLIDFSIDRTEENEGTICIKGAQFYDEMSEVLKGFSLDKIKKKIRLNFLYLQVHLMLVERRFIGMISCKVYYQKVLRENEGK